MQGFTVSSMTCRSQPGVRMSTWRTADCGMIPAKTPIIHKIVLAVFFKNKDTSP